MGKYLIPALKYVPSGTVVFKHFNLMKKECQVVMLPTEKASPLFKDIDGNGKLEYDPVLSSYGGVNHQFLYILSDDEIKEDWCFRKGNNSFIKDFIFKASKEWLIENYESLDLILPTYLKTKCQKIIATNDKELNDKGVARPSNEFLKKYCDVGGIDKVLVLYEDVQTEYINCVWYPNYKLKVAPDNTITIYPIVSEEIEEKMYSREEVMKMIDKAINSWSHDGYVDYNKIF